MKRKLSAKSLRQWSADKIAGRTLIVLIALSVVVFGVFYIVGFNLPFEDDVNFNAPLFTDLLLYFMYLLLFATTFVFILAVVRGIKMRDKSKDVSNGVPAVRIVFGVVGLLVASLVATFAFGSGEPMIISGERFAETFWLKVTDMFINTSIVLMIVAICAVCYGLSGWNRKLRIKN